MSTDTPAEETTQARKRNPLERIVVWGAIGILLLVVLVEARAQYGYSQSLEAIRSAMDDPEEAQVSLEDVRGMMAFAPSERDGEHTSLVNKRVFSWPSIFKSGQFEITVDVSNDEESQVLTFATAGAPEEKFEYNDFVDPNPDFGMGGGGGGNDDDGGAGGYPGGGGSFEPPRDPLAEKIDANGDGEISAEEIEAAAAVLETLDTNADGELTLDEFAPGGRGRGGRPGGFGGGDAGPGESESTRPRRPQLDDE